MLFTNPVPAVIRAGIHDSQEELAKYSRAQIPKSRREVLMLKLILANKSQNHRVRFAFWFAKVILKLMNKFSV